VTDPISRKVSLATGIDYHILEWGGDDTSRDHTVLLVHGFLDIAWGWAATVRAGLGERYHVIAPDMRGHGDSDRVGAGGYYHFMDYLADLHELVGQVSRGTLSIVGHSMGGSISSYYTGSYPDRVHRLVVMEGMGPPESDTPAPTRVSNWLAGWKRARERGQRSYENVAAAAAQLQKNDSLLDADIARELAELGTVVGDDGRLRFKHDPLHATMGPYPYRVDIAAQFWRAITCPVLLIEADKSGFRHTPEEAERRHGAFADARHAVLRDAGHMMQRHQPAALAELLIEFLDG
jgi:pimeloyl-ACP methyl ester carboxylesterase